MRLVHNKGPAAAASQDPDHRDDNVILVATRPRFATLSIALLFSDRDSLVFEIATHEPRGTKISDTRLILISSPQLWQRPLATHDSSTYEPRGTNHKCDAVGARGEGTGLVLVRREGTLHRGAEDSAAMTAAMSRGLVTSPEEGRAVVRG